MPVANVDRWDDRDSNPPQVPPTWSAYRFRLEDIIAKLERLRHHATDRDDKAPTWLPSSEQRCLIIAHADLTALIVHLAFQLES